MPSTPWYEKHKLGDEFVQRNFGSANDTILTGTRLDFDRPNLHQNKQDFDDELLFVTKSSDDLFSLYQGFNTFGDAEVFNPHGIGFNFFKQAIDRQKKEQSPKSALDLVLSNIRTVDYFPAMKRIVFDLYLSFSARKSELEEQKQLFWSSRGRPPDHYARIMALRLAKLYGKKRQMKPTIGTASEGDHPSTEYGRLVQELFEILEIETGFRLPAEWAISQLIEEDFSPPKPVGLGEIWGLPNLGLFGGNKSKDQS